MYSPADIDKTIPGSAIETAALGRIDKYELVRELGEGGFGAVYLARDTVAGIDVAIKGLPPEVKHNESELESIRANFALVSRLRHPNIVGLRDLHRAERVSYASKEVEEKLRVFERDTMVVMDYAPGATLAKWRRQFPDAKVPLDKAIEIARQIASALDAAHAQKVLHRDVKPENVMVETREDGSFVARILDFGLAAEIRSSMGRVSRKILDTSGTRPYMAPEQWLGEEQNAATDQYALAVLFYELVTGKTPFSSVFDCGDTAVMRLAVTTDAPKIPASLPKNMRKALAVALSKKPEERFASCGDFVAALEGRKAKVPRGGAEPRSGGGRAALAAAAFAALALAGGVLWLGTARDPVEPEPTTRNAPYNQPPSAPPAPAPEPAKPAPVPAKPATSALDGSAASRSEDETVRKRAAEFVTLKTRINIKVSDAREKLKRIDAFRADPDGLTSHIKSADEQKKVLDALATPNSLEEAKAAFDMADKAESQIALDLDWLQKNKTGRDAAKSARAEIAALLKGDAATFKAEKYASAAYRDGKRLRDEGEAAFGDGDFAEAGRLMERAHEKFADAAKEAKAFFVKTTLGSAQEYFSASQWQSCIKECDKVLGWDAGNIEASDLKNKANAQLVPSAKAIAKIGGREVAAKFKIGGREYTGPTWETLTAGRNLMDCDAEVEYTEGGKRYIGVLKNCKIDWRGPKTLVVQLTEYVGPKHGDAKTLILPGGAPMDMIYIAPGSFTMGSPSSEDGRYSDETQHRVTLKKGYWLGKYEVTQKQWQSVMGSNPSDFKGDSLPVESVSWKDCQEFVAKVDAICRRQLGGGARLPTEAEWEYACRAGTTTAYSWGNALNGDKANCDGNYPCGTTVKGPYKQRTAAVGSYQPNTWGFYDMHGNVWEWCQDWYGSYDGAATDPSGPASGSDRVLRGGGWYVSARFCRSAYRFRNGPGSRNWIFGFRLCCSAGPRD